MLKKTIILNGMGFSGKSSIGKLLSEKFKTNFFDIDVEMLKKFNLNTSEEFIKKYGRPMFHILEQQIIDGITFKLNKSVIISLGGKTLTIDVEDNRNNNNFFIENKEKFFLISILPSFKDLEFSKKILTSRIIKNNNKLDKTEVENEVISKLKNRIDYYKEGDYLYDTLNKSIDEITNELFNYVLNNPSLYK